MRFSPVRENPDLSIHPDPPGLWQHVAVCCRWWAPERGRRDWPHASVVAPLRTVEGLDELVRNLLANPQIRVLLVVGPDSIDGQPATRAMKAFFVSDGVGLSGRGTSQENLEEDLRTHPLLDRARILMAMESEAPGLFIRDYQMFSVPGTDPDLLDVATRDPHGFLQFLHQSFDMPAEEPVILPPPPPRANAPAPHGDPGDRVAADTLSDLWPAVLRQAMRFGRVVPTQYGNTREYLNLVAVIRDPKASVYQVLNLGKDEAHPVLGLTTREAVSYYRDNLVAKDPPEDSLHGYGSRLRGHPDQVDQLEAVHNLLSSNPGTRAAFVTPWRPAEDAGLESGRPCLVQILFRYEQESGLHMTVVFRSHDLYAAYPKNLAALCMLLVDQAGRLGVEVGTLTCVSSSAHVYERQWDKAVQVGDQHHPKGLQLDQRSNWRLERRDQVKNGRVQTTLVAIAMHPDATGRKVGVLEASTSAGLRRKIAESGLVTSVEAALWLGQEIEIVESRKPSIQVCDNCWGTGNDATEELYGLKCQRCGGSGSVPVGGR